MSRCNRLALLAKAARRAAANPRAWDRLPAEGHPELRLWFARDVGGNARAEDVVLAPGGQAALAATFRTLVPFGGPILVESPTYFGALSVARSLGLKPVPVPLDAEGIRADLLEAAFASSGARALYLQPAFSNPSGVTLSEQRRKDVLRLAERAGAFVIEDDYARDLAFGAAPPAPLFRQGGDRVVYIRSLTKSTAPGLRVAGIVAKGPVLGRLRTLRATEDFFVAGILQDTALELVNAAGFRNYVQKLRQTLRERRDVTVRALARHLPQARLCPHPRGRLQLVGRAARWRRRSRVRRGRRARRRLAHSGRALVCSGAPGRVRAHQHRWRECDGLGGGDCALGRPLGDAAASTVRAGATQRMTGTFARTRAIVQEIFEDCLARG